MGAWKEPDGNAARGYRKYKESNEENQKGEKKGQIITFCAATNGALFGSEQRRNHRMV